jgi:23S rRNA (cytosine1962-C5)-methyltransferase
MIETLITDPWKDYALIDSGHGRKLERYGAVIVDRPEAQALWSPSTPAAWNNAHARFSNSPKDEDSDNGQWEFLKKPPAAWPVTWNNLTFECRLMSFRHMGLFPEQASHWALIDKLIARANRPLKILNLFAYTGAGSLVAAARGCEVVHLDASKKAIGWAKDNQKASRLDKAKIRWICDDANDFVERELRRGNKYDAILLDPPKYGRGPDGQIWSLERDLPKFLENCINLLSDDAAFLILTCYALRLSPYTLDGLMRSSFASRGGAIQSGELLLKPEQSPYLLPTSLYSLWSK